MTPLQLCYEHVCLSENQSLWEALQQQFIIGFRFCLCGYVLQDLSSGQRKSGKLSRRESSCSGGSSLGRCSSQSAQDSSSSSTVASRKDNEWESTQFSEALVPLKPLWRFSCICCNSGGYKSFGSYPKISHFCYLFLPK